MQSKPFPTYEALAAANQRTKSTLPDAPFRGTIQSVSELYAIISPIRPLTA